jgi:hypothetical protein
VPAARADRVPVPHRSRQRRRGRAVAPLPNLSQGAGHITALPVVRRLVIRGVSIAHGGWRRSVRRAMAHSHRGHHAEERQHRRADDSDEVCHGSRHDTRRSGVKPVPWPLAARRAHGPPRVAANGPHGLQLPLQPRGLLPRMVAMPAPPPRDAHPGRAAAPPYSAASRVCGHAVAPAGAPGPHRGPPTAGGASSGSSGS